MMKRSSIAWAFSFLTVVSAARAEAEQPLPPSAEGPRFGSRHTLAISGDFVLAAQRYSSTSFSSETNVTVRPVLDYFVLDHLSVGGLVEFGYMGSPAPLNAAQLSFAFGPRVGYEIALADRFSLWPTVGTSYVRAWDRYNGQSVGPARWTLNAFAGADLIGQIAPHLYMGLGPYLTTQIARSGGDASGTGYGVTSTLGGWI
jgi:hypothetical protein